jgi:hypothetical protein
MGHVVHSGASAACNGDVLFFILGVGGGPLWIRQKKRNRTRYAELVFLHPVGYVGHIVHSSAFGE